MAPLVRSLSVTIRANHFTFSDLSVQSFKRNTPLATADAPQVEAFLSSDVIEVHHVVGKFFFAVNARFRLCLLNQLTSLLPPPGDSQSYLSDSTVPVLLVPL